MPGTAYDVAIAGGGIVGACCAAEFAVAGLKVALVEPGVIGGGATAAGMGHIAVMDDSEAQFALTRYSQQLWQELSQRLPDDAEYDKRGAVWVAADEEEMQEVRRKHEFYSKRNVPVDVVDGDMLQRAGLNLRPGLAGGLWMSDESMIYAPCAARFLAQEARDHGADIFAGRKMTGLDARLDDGTILTAGAVVLACGTSEFGIPEGVIRPRKGHLAITDRYPGHLPHALIELGYLKNAHSMDADSVAFNVQPRKTGQILIGSSRQFGVDDPAVEQPMLGKMLQRAIEYMPSLAGLQIVRTWTGFRAATVDKLPLIGRHPAHNNVYLALGHEGLGISMATGTARLLLDMLLNRESAIPREPYLPERETIRW